MKADRTNTGHTLPTWLAREADLLVIAEKYPSRSSLVEEALAKYLAGKGSHKAEDWYKYLEQRRALEKSVRS